MRGRGPYPKVEPRPQTVEVSEYVVRVVVRGGEDIRKHVYAACERLGIFEVFRASMGSYEHVGFYKPLDGARLSVAMREIGYEVLS